MFEFISTRLTHIFVFATDNKLSLTFQTSIHRTEKDWYIYQECFAHKNSKIAYKSTKKNCKRRNAVSIGTTTVKPYLYIYPVGLVWFARYCGKMYSRHLFSYSGLFSRAATDYTFPRFYHLHAFPGYSTCYRSHVPAEFRLANYTISDHNYVYISH